jgi:tetratricopeptide (TPR) repeat protein
MAQIEHQADKRLYGWKMIAAYFRRDRTTVMRWARDRNLPVHRLPGGKHGSVFALEHELASWSLNLEDIDLPETVAAIPNHQRENQPLPAAERAQTVAPDWERAALPAAPRQSIAVLAASLLLFAGLVFAWPTLGPVVKHKFVRSAELPADPAVAGDYLTARDMWARRTPSDIVQAITLYRSVIHREPDFAPAYAGLADAWLILREYGDVNDPQAYRAAAAAAEQALRLDSGLAGAHRAIGFIKYWWSNDASAAIAAFERAAALEGDDPQTHFWFANMLADMGDHERARSEYNRARLLSPGSRAIETEYAFSNWHAGEDGKALRLLNALAARYPEDATIRDCLAWIHIANGDIAGFAREYKAMARNRGRPDLLRLSASLDAAVAHNPATAHRLLIAEARREIADGTRRLRKTPAFYASSMGDRTTLVALMTEARDLGEVWYTASIAARIALRWRGDPEVKALLNKLHPGKPRQTA